MVAGTDAGEVAEAELQRGPREQGQMGSGAHGGPNDGSGNSEGVPASRSAVVACEANEAPARSNFDEVVEAVGGWPA